MQIVLQTLETKALLVLCPQIFSTEALQSIQQNLANLQGH